MTYYRQYELTEKYMKSPTIVERIKTKLPCNSRVCINKLTYQRQFLVHRNCQNYALPWIYLNWVLGAIHNEFHLVVLWIIRPSCFGTLQIPLLSLSHRFTHATILRGFPLVIHISVDGLNNQTLKFFWPYHERSYAILEFWNLEHMQYRI